MNRSMILMLGLASPALVAVGSFTPPQDGLTLSPLPAMRTDSDQPTATIDTQVPAPEEKMTILEHPISLDTHAIPRPQSDDLGGFIYEPVYSATSDRVEYRLESGIGVGVATDAAWAISHSVRLKRGLDLSIYYLRAMGDGSRDTGRQAGIETALPAAESSAGIRLEWKF